MSNYDLGSIGWTVESKGTKEALNEVANLGRNLLDAEGSALAFAKAILKAERDLQTLAVFNQKAAKSALSFRDALDSITGVSGTYKSAEVSAKSFEQVLYNQEIQARKTALAINSITGVSGVSAVDSGAGFSAIDQEYTRLKTKFDQIYASSQLYEMSLKEIDAAHRIGAISASQQKVAVDGLNREYQEFSAGTANSSNRFVAQSRQSSLGFNRMGVAVQQVGYQVGDFLVQVQSGTNVLVAFGQQATQLAGLVTTLGGKWIAIGAVLSIVIPLVTAIGAAFMRTKKDTDSGKDSIDMFAEALEGLHDKIKKGQLDELKFKFSVEDSDVAVALEKIQDTKNKINAILTAAMPPLVGSRAGGSVQDQTNKIKAEREERLNSLRAETKETEALLVILRQQEGLAVGRAAAEEASRIQNMIKLDILDRQRASQLMLNALIGASASLLQNQVNAAHARQLAYMGKSVAQSNAMAQAMRDIVAAGATDNAKLFADAMQRALDKGVAFSTVDLSTVVAVAASHGWDLAASLQAAWVAAQGASVTAPVNSGTGASTGGSGTIVFGAGLNSSPRAKQAPNDIDFGVPDAVSGGGGGGGSASDPIKDLIEQLRLEDELLTKTEAQKKLISALGDEWRNYSPEVLAGLEQQIQAQIDFNAKIEEQQGLYDSVGSAMEDSFMNIITGTETVGEAFRNMVYNIIEELYKVLVVQRMVGSFDVASSTGTGLSGLIGGLFTGKAVGGSVNSNTPYLVGERGPELIVPRHSGTVINAQQTSAGNTATSQTVQNNITVTGSDADSVRREISKMVPQIVNATKAAMIDSKRRGGQMGSAFR